MQKIDLDDKYLDEIKEILKRFIPESDAEFYIFGSRVKGKAKKYSDIDIAITCGERVFDDSIRIPLEKFFEETTIPYKVDIVDLNSITQNFKDNIKNDLVRI